MNYDAKSWYVTEYEEKKNPFQPPPPPPPENVWEKILEIVYKIIDFIKAWIVSHNFTWLTRRNVAIAFLILVEISVVVGLIILALYRFGYI